MPDSANGDGLIDEVLAALDAIEDEKRRARLRIVRDGADRPEPGPGDVPR